MVYATQNQSRGAGSDPKVGPLAPSGNTREEQPYLRGIDGLPREPGTPFWVQL